MQNNIIITCFNINYSKPSKRSKQHGRSAPLLQFRQKEHLLMYTTEKGKSNSREHNKITSRINITLRIKKNPLNNKIFYFDVSCGVKVANILQFFFSQCLLSTSDKACMKHQRKHITVYAYVYWIESWNIHKKLLKILNHY